MVLLKKYTPARNNKQKFIMDSLKIR